MPKVYLSAPYHWYNKCAVAGCDENTHNNKYLDELEVYLHACGIETMRGYRRPPYDSTTDGNELMKLAVKESNEWGADIHYVSHTNGFDGTVRGCRPMIYPGSEGGKKLAALMIAYREKIYQPISLIERSDLYELSETYAVAFYEEHVFHDNEEDAKWFHDNMRHIAECTARAMCDYFGLPFVDPYAVKHQVVLGTYETREEADKALREMHRLLGDAQVALSQLDAMLRKAEIEQK